MLLGHLGLAGGLAGGALFRRRLGAACLLGAGFLARLAATGLAGGLAGCAFFRRQVGAAGFLRGLAGCGATLGGSAATRAATAAIFSSVLPINWVIAAITMKKGNSVSSVR